MKLKCIHLILNYSFFFTSNLLSKLYLPPHLNIQSTTDEQNSQVPHNIFIYFPICIQNFIYSICIPYFQYFGS